MADRRHRHRGIRSVPCLLVDDIEAAAAYYRDRLGFDQIDLLENPPVAAMVRRGPAAILLQGIHDSADTSHRRFADHAWDALVEVDDINAVAHDLRGRGAEIQVGLGITAVSDRTLEVRDPWGNVLAFAEATVGRRARLRRAVRRTVPARARRAWTELGRSQQERPHRQRLAAFCRGLDGRDPFYMFFTRGLLHWVCQAARHVPDEVNLAFIGSDLPDDELQWLRTHTGRPVHNINFGVDDNTTWEFLFAAHDRNFGWLDIDCFVLEPLLFTEMAHVDPDVAVNGIWTYDAAAGKPIACTHFVFINADVARNLRRSGAAMSPANYDWTGSNISLMHPRTNCHVPTAGQRRQLLRVLPADEQGRPRPPGDSPFFDTLVAYQVAAYGNGFRTHPVRPLVHRTQQTLVDNAGDRRVWQQDMSNDVVHVGGVSYYRRFFHSPQLRAMYVAVEYAMLRATVAALPASYRDRLRRRETELSRHHLTPEEAITMLRRHLVEDRGLSADIANRIIDADPSCPRQNARQASGEPPRPPIPSAQSDLEV